MVVITDEQSHDQVPAPRGRGYVINVASNRNGVGYGAWMHVDGWSEAVVEFIAELESTDRRVSGCRRFPSIARQDRAMDGAHGFH